MKTIIRPQAGPQEKFLSTPADIAIYGGAAGGGKSWALLLEVLRGINNPRYNAALFRRSYPMIRNPGGLWDASNALFPLVGARSRETNLTWTFPSGAVAVMRHLKLERDMFSWQGSEIVYIGFDEMCHFSEAQFWYLMSRNRSTCGIRPFIRGTCNPDAESWVRPLIDWWIGEDGLAIPERSGVVRYFTRQDGEIVWSNEPIENSKSFTFITASIFDNQELLRKDPGYLINLRSLPLVERERLLGGNWDVNASAGKVFRSEWFSILDHRPTTASLKQVRFWDFAATDKQNQGDDPDWTVGIRMVLYDGRPIVADVVRLRGTPNDVDRAILNTAAQDGAGCPQRWFRDPAQAGVYQDSKLRQLLRGYDAMGLLCPYDKYTLAKPFSRAVEFGEVALLRAAWNQDYLNELSQFPDGGHDDQVDASSGAYAYLTGSDVLRRPANTGSARI